jgi:hypothetical protein
VQNQQPFILGELSEVHELAVFDMKRAVLQNLRENKETLQSE